MANNNEPVKDGNINVFGSRFEVEVNFGTALTGAKKLDEAMKALPGTFNTSINAMIGHLERLEQKFNSVLNKATALSSALGGGTIATGAGGGGGTRGGGGGAHTGATAAPLIAPSNDATPQKATSQNLLPAGGLIPQSGGGRPRAGGAPSLFPEQRHPLPMVGSPNLHHLNEMMALRQRYALPTMSRLGIIDERNMTTPTGYEPYRAGGRQRYWNEGPPGHWELTYAGTRPFYEPRQPYQRDSTDRARWEANQRHWAEFERRQYAQFNPRASSFWAGAGAVSAVRGDPGFNYRQAVGSAYMRTQGDASWFGAGPPGYFEDMYHRQYGGVPLLGEGYIDAEYRASGRGTFATARRRRQLLTSDLARWGRGLERGTSLAFSGASGIGNFIGSAGFWRLAGGAYLGSMAVRAGGGLARNTIGTAAEEQEGRILLAESLRGGNIGLSATEAAIMANQLVDRRYLTGTDNLSAVGLGLDRASLAEQYRQLAPIVRLHADDPAMFSESLQRGSLARQLLVARDPVQGTRGAMVALSELYAGGEDRFRSLAMRFELPRSRMVELEAQYQASGHSYDPVLILLDVLTEMGIGPEYVKTRARETLPGQMARMGAMGSNLRIDMFQQSLSTTISNITRLNDAFETFANSDAYDRTLNFLDSFFGGITAFVGSPVTNFLAGRALRFGGYGDPRNTAIGALDMMQSAGRGEYWSLKYDGENQRSILTAVEAFTEAVAQSLTDRLGVIAGAPRYNPNANMRMNTLLYGGGLMLSGSLLSRGLFGMGAGSLLGPLMAGGDARAGALSRMGAGFRGVGLPMLATLGAAGILAGATESSSTAKMLGRFTDSEFSEMFGRDGLILDTGGLGGPARRRRLEELRWRGGLSSAGRFIAGVGDATSLDWNRNPLLQSVRHWFDSDYITDADAAGMASQQVQFRNTLMGLALFDPELSGLEGDDLARAFVGIGDRLAEENPEFMNRLTPGQRGAMYAGIADQLSDPTTRLGTMLPYMTFGAISHMSSMGRGLELELPGGGTIGFGQDEAAGLRDDYARSQEIAADIIAAFEGDEEKLYELLAGIIGYTRSIDGNTKDTADAITSALAPTLRLSNAPGLFYGYDPNPDWMTVGKGLPGSFANPWSGGSAAAPSRDGASSSPNRWRSDVQGTDPQLVMYGTASGLTSFPGVANYANPAFQGAPTTVDPHNVMDAIRRSGSGSLIPTDSDILQVTGAARLTSFPGMIYGTGAPGGLAGNSHKGVDLAGFEGGLIHSFFREPVTVVSNEWSAGGLGNKLMVKTESGNVYDLGHFAEPPGWERGQKIYPGDFIGIEGDTGLADGKHLHAALAYDDPRNYDNELFRAIFGADTLFPPGGGVDFDAHDRDDNTGANLRMGDVTFQINVDASGAKDGQEVAAAVRMELDRFVRDGGMEDAVQTVAQHRRRQGKATDGMNLRSNILNEVV